MKRFDISLSDFRKIRQNGKYYVDKTLLIQEFIERNEEITLITRPRRFGKTTAMTMLADFFDIEKDSRQWFQGLQIMDTEYAALINTRPVIFLSFRDCDSSTAEELLVRLNETIYYAFDKLETDLHKRLDIENRNTQRFLKLLDKLQEGCVSYSELSGSLELMTRICQYYYKTEPLLLIDEYDQPLLASHVHHYHEKVGTALAAFYTKALKDNPFIYRALMTGIQRIAKESIFSKFNNPAVYTVLDKPYHTCFGFTEEETRTLLAEAGLELDEETREMYDGYRFSECSIYNPSSVMGYAQNQIRKTYWLNTSSNKLIQEAIAAARNSEVFRLKYEKLLEKGSAQVSAILDTSYQELKKPSTLWGLLINAGYLTVTESDTSSRMTVQIPNKEVRREFLNMIAEELELENDMLEQLFDALVQHQMDLFLERYQEIILTSTSYYDGKENAYHMFFLGMCMSLTGKYKVTSNLESGLGRHDIVLNPVKDGLNPIVIEFKQISADEKKAELYQKACEAVKQIKDKKYYAGLKGNILFIGIAHQGKRCAMKDEWMKV